MTPSEKEYDPVNVAIGTAIRDKRKQLGRTLKQVEDATAISLGYLSQLELGKNSASIATLTILCRALGMRISEVLAIAERATAPRTGRPIERPLYEAVGAETALTVLAVDDRTRAPGGANHRYDFVDLDTSANPARMDGTPDAVAPSRTVSLLFQNGPVTDRQPPNGVTIEAVLAACIDRLVGFQLGQFASDHNASAIGKIHGAIDDLLQRTWDRVARGVEGRLEA